MFDVKVFASVQRNSTALHTTIVKSEKVLTWLQAVCIMHICSQYKHVLSTTDVWDFCRNATEHIYFFKTDVRVIGPSCKQIQTAPSKDAISNTICNFHMSLINH